MKPSTLIIGAGIAFAMLVVAIGIWPILNRPNPPMSATPVINRSVQPNAQQSIKPKIQLSGWWSQIVTECEWVPVNTPDEQYAFHVKKRENPRLVNSEDRITISWDDFGQREEMVHFKTIEVTVHTPSIGRWL